MLEITRGAKVRETGKYEFKNVLTYWILLEQLNEEEYIDRIGNPGRIFLEP